MKNMEQLWLFRDFRKDVATPFPTCNAKCDWYVVTRKESRLRC